MDSSQTRREQKLMITVVAAALFLLNLDGSIIVVALPQIASSFGMETFSVTSAVTSYVLATAAFVPASGWAADRFGARTVFSAALLLFILSSLLCAYADSYGMFIAGRLMQGSAAAMILPIGRLVVLKSVPRSELVPAIAALIWPSLVAPVIAPPLGGFIVQYASWNWIFLINVPLGLLALVFIHWLVPDYRSESPGRFDFAGFGLSSLALVLALVGMDGLAHAGSPWLSLLALTCAVVAGMLAIRRFRRSAAPLIDLAPLRERTFALASIGSGALMRAAISMTPFLLPLFFQLGFGYGPAAAGSMMMAYMGGNLLMKSVTTPLLRRFGFRNVLVLNGLIVGVTLLAIGFLTPDIPVGIMVALLFVAGLARSMELTATTTLTYSGVASAHMSAAATIATMSHQMSQAMGVAAAATMLVLAQAIHGGDAVMLNFMLAFAMAAALAFLALPGFLRLSVDTGQDVTRPQGR